MTNTHIYIIHYTRQTHIYTHDKHTYLHYILHMTNTHIYIIYYTRQTHIYTHDKHTYINI